MSYESQCHRCGKVRLIGGGWRTQADEYYCQCGANFDMHHNPNPQPPKDKATGSAA